MCLVFCSEQSKVLQNCCNALCLYFRIWVYTIFGTVIVGRIIHIGNIYDKGNIPVDTLFMSFKKKKFKWNLCEKINFLKYIKRKFYDR